MLETNPLEKKKNSICIYRQSMEILSLFSIFGKYFQSSNPKN